MSNPISTNKDWLKGRNKLRSGFCGNGHCEGERPKNFRGVPLKTCPIWMECPCSCHEKLDNMYELIGVERTLQDNPEYKPDRGNYIMPDIEELIRQRRLKEEAEGRMSVSNAADEEILSGNAFTGTEMGRRNPRQLEYQTLIACVALGWPRADIFDVTPKWISEYIANAERIASPSTGAIQAIWDRWVTLGFASYHKKPVRFGGFADTETKPTIEILDTIREKYKREQKFKAANTRRTTIRGARK